MASFEKCITVLAGLPLTGKTTIGQLLSKQAGVEFYDIDRARREIHPGDGWLGPEKEKEIMMQSYKSNHQKADEELKRGNAVILAATYSRPDYHDMITELARSNGVPIKFFQLILPEDEVAKRMEARNAAGSDSNITSMEGYQEVRDRYQGFPEPTEVIDASKSPEKITGIILPHLVKA